MSADPAYRVAVLLRHNLLLRLRDPGHLISYLVMPMVLMLAFQPVFGAANTGGPAQVVVGMTVMFSVLSLTVVGNSLVTERVWRTWDRLRATPVSVVELLLGKTMPVFALLVLQQALLLVFGTSVVGMTVDGPVVLLGFAVVVWSLTLLAVGSALAMVVRSTAELNAISDVGALLLSALGGALAPVSLLPGWVQAIAPISPGYWAVTMLKDAVAGEAGGVLRASVVLACIAIAAGVFACVRASRGLSLMRG
ncbi:ABC transporter permease [Amycolatopsis sp. GM8]|uniref:ABC transporter permease n=1 Tax=Amycolatopsis sp. GM8 TaxID=2896530 RepID=UPI001F2DEC13|nr:ABC transporter permease [Amycolatopsis sp. GM8]